MSLDKLSDADFDALERGDLTALSDEGLNILETMSGATAPPVQESGDTDPNAEGLQFPVVLRDKRDPQRAAERRQHPDFSDKMLGSMPGRIALGVATPVYGAGQLGANVGDWLSEKMGNEPIVGDWLNQNWDRVQDMKYRGMTTPEERAAGEQPWDVAGGLANVATAFASAPKVAGGALSKLGQMLGGTSKVGAKLIPRVAQGATTGAVYGGAQPGMDLEEQGEGAAWGGGLSGLGPAAAPVMKGLGKVVGPTWDLLGGNSSMVRAGKIARDAAGGSLGLIKGLVAKARPNINAGQAVQEFTDAPTWQALQKLADDYRPDQARDLLNFQQAARRQGIEQVTPNLDAALTNRAGNAKLNYGLAEKVGDANIANGSSADALQALEELRSNPVLKSAGNLVAKFEEHDDPLAKMSGLHEIKMAIDKRISQPSTDTGFGHWSDAAVEKSRNQLLTQIEKISPLYAGAKRGFAKDSEDVNQAETLIEILRRLNNPVKGENPNSFMNALGNGAEALIKKATGQARFEAGDLAKVLTGKGQMDAVRQAEREVIRDARMEGLAGDGSKRLGKIVTDNSKFFRIPSMLSRTTTATNTVLDVLQNKIGETSMKILAEGMQSGRGLKEILDTLPAAERFAALKVLNDPETALRIARASNAGVAAGAD